MSDLFAGPSALADIMPIEQTPLRVQIAEVLRRAGFKVGFTSTAMFSDGDKDWLNDKKMTMPGRFFNFKI